MFVAANMDLSPYGFPKFITPAVTRAGWDEDTQIRREVGFPGQLGDFAALRRKLSSLHSRRMIDFLRLGRYPHSDSHWIDLESPTIGSTFSCSLSLFSWPAAWINLFPSRGHKHGRRIQHPLACQQTAGRVERGSSRCSSPFIRRYCRNSQLPAHKDD